jgi:antiviral helicase SKI2
MSKYFADFPAADDFLAEMLGSQNIAAKAKRRRRDGGSSPTLEVSRLGDEESGLERAQENGSSIPGKKNVDDLLPIGVSGISQPSGDHNKLTAYSGCLPRRHLGSSFELRRRRSGLTSWTSTRSLRM